jgi:Flp pilus assembly protein TadB
VSGLGLLIVLTGGGAVGLLLLISGWLQPAPSLARTLDHLQRPGDIPATDGRAGSGRIGQHIAKVLRIDARLLPSDSQLSLAGRSAEQQSILMVGAALAGLVGPALILGILQAAGVIGIGWTIPVVVAVGCTVLGPVLVHLGTIEKAGVVHTDMRYQVSAYLDVVTMLLAGNSGYEGALEQAAHAGDGRLFIELRRRMRESGTRGASLTDALQRTGEDLGLEELEQIAATASLSAAEGAPVARTLAAKCSTLRAALSTDQESEARLRTSRLTTPIVGMSLIFMSLVIYPALSFS